MRITEKGHAVERKGQAARMKNSPFAGPIVGPKGGGGQKMRPPGSKPVSGGGIQGGLALSRSAGSLVQPPSWDPMKGKLSVESLRHAPLWRTAAVEGKTGSTSLMRAIASTGTLVRPSVKLLEEHQQQSARTVQRHISSCAPSSLSIEHPLHTCRSHAQPSIFIEPPLV